MEERDHIINTLKTKISLLRNGGENNLLLLDSNDKSNEVRFRLNLLFMWLLTLADFDFIKQSGLKFIIVNDFKIYSNFLFTLKISRNPRCKKKALF